MLPPGAHPALAVALTLRAVGGLTTAQIARAFLVPEATMAQRISRAKQTIRDSGVPFRLPAPAECAERLRIVLHVLYLISTRATPQRRRAISAATSPPRRSAWPGCCTRRCPSDGEVAGLLALMLLTDARRAARIDADGRPVPLADRTAPAGTAPRSPRARRSSTPPSRRGSVGEYQLLAAVAAIHDRRPAPRPPTGARSVPCTSSSSG